MTQTNLFDHLVSPEESKRFVAKLFRVEEFWHCKIIKGIDIIDRDNYYVIQNTENDAKRAVKSLLAKNGHTGKIGFEYLTPRQIHPIFFYRYMYVEVLNIEGAYLLQNKISDKVWSMIGSVLRNGTYIIETIEISTNLIKPCNSLELSTKYRAKEYIK